jgi:IS5 family transposase
MLRIYYMRPWYAMSDPDVKDALYGIESMHRFIGLELTEDRDSRRDDDSGVSSLAGAT